MTIPADCLRLTEFTVDDLLELLASNQPTPGGGSAAALAGAMAAALVCMVTQLTIGRAQYAEVDEEMQRVRDRANALRNCLAALADEDALAYQAVLRSYSLPKATEAESTARAAEIQRTLCRAAEIPREVAAACSELTDLAAWCAAHGNRNAASDAAVASLLAHASMHGAILNVRTNLKYIEDESFNSTTETHLSQLRAAGEAALARGLASAGLGV